MQETYLVQVNNKYLLKVNAVSKTKAEQTIYILFEKKINDYRVITATLAFDRDDLKTDWFYEEYLTKFSLISMNELEKMIDEYVDAREEESDWENLVRKASQAVENKKEELKSVEKNRDEVIAQRERYIKKCKSQEEKLGMVVEV